MDMSLRKVADLVIEDLRAQVGATLPPSGLPLAKLLARVAQLSSMLLEEPSKNKHNQTIRSMPEVGLFYTFLYANMPPQACLRWDSSTHDYQDDDRMTCY
jgi:peroxin-3